MSNESTQGDGPGGDLDVGNLGLFVDPDAPDSGPGGDEGASQSVKTDQGKVGAEERTGDDGDVDSRLSRSFAEIARKDAELQAEKRRLKEYQSKVEQWKGFQQAIRDGAADPSAALRAYRDAGGDPYILAEAVLGQKVEPEKEDAVSNAEIDKLRKTVEALQQQQQQQQVEHFKRSEQSRYAKTISENKDKYSVLAAFADDGIIDEIYHGACLRYDNEKAWPEDDDILSAAEEKLTERLRNVISRVKSVAKFSDVLQAATAAPPIDTPQSDRPSLSSDRLAEPPSVETRKMTDADREAEFLRIIAEKGWTED